MLVFAYAPFASWILSGFMAFYYRSLYHRTHVNGQILAALLLYTFSFKLPVFRASSDPATTCASELPERPAEEISSIWFTFLFMIAYDSHAGSAGSKLIIERPYYTTVKILAMLAIACVSTYAQVYLHLFRWEQVLLAGVTSVMSGCVYYVLFYNILYPHIDHWISQWVVWLCGVRKSSIDEFYTDPF